MYQENICVLASAPNKENARKFMEFYLRPEIAALNVSQQFNGTPNTPANALTPDVIKSNPNINRNSPPTTAIASTEIVKIEKSFLRRLFHLDFLAYQET